MEALEGIEVKVVSDKWVTRIVNYTNKFPWKVRRPIYERIGLISRGV